MDFLHVDKMLYAFRLSPHSFYMLYLFSLHLNTLSASSRVYQLKILQPIGNQKYDHTTWYASCALQYQLGIGQG